MRHPVGGRWLGTQQGPCARVGPGPLSSRRTAPARTPDHALERHPTHELIAVQGRQAPRSPVACSCVRGHLTPKAERPDAAARRCRQGPLHAARPAPRRDGEPARPRRHPLSGPQSRRELRLAARRHVANRHRAPVQRRLARPELRTARDYVLVQRRTARGIDAALHEQAQGHEVQTERLAGGATRALGMLHRVGVGGELAQNEQRRHAVQVGQHPLVGPAAPGRRGSRVGVSPPEAARTAPQAGQRRRTRRARRPRGSASTADTAASSAPGAAQRMLSRSVLASTGASCST